MTISSNVPKLRFPAFTDAWEQRKLSDLAEVRTEKHLAALILVMMENI